MPMPAFPLVRLAAFRTELHACCTRRADALFDLADALLCAPAVSSVAQLSLEPTHRRGWGSAYAALASGRIDAERLRDLLVRSLPDADPLVFAVDVTTWPRCDAECSPSRGYYYHPSRHSAGQPIIAGWAFQWIAQLSFDRDSWTAPVDARRLHPLDDTDQTAAAQARALLARLPAGGPVPWLVFDGGYDSAQLSLDLADAGVAVLVRLRSDRCFYADPPPRSPGTNGRPRRHGAKFNCADPTTWPTPTATLVCHDDQYGTVTVKAWAGLHPKQQRHPGHGSRGPRPIVRGTILRVAVERVPAKTRPPKVLWLWWAGPVGLQLDLAGQHRPGPAVGRLRVARPRGRPAEGLLGEPDGVLQVEPPDVGPPDPIQVEFVRAGPPQPQHLGRARAGRDPLDLDADDRAAHDRPRPAAAVARVALLLGGAALPTQWRSRCRTGRPGRPGWRSRSARWSGRRS